MTRFVLLRHGPTAWNVAGRIQGRRDEPLSPEGRAAVGRWRLPPDLAGYRWLTSPLVRARETARLLGIDDAAVDPRLAEMDWGAWEGERLVDLRAHFGPEMAANEARGLDFRPPGGESPRDVQARLAPLLAEIAVGGHPTAAVAHRGVIRAVLALATGWDMLGRPPARLAPETAYAFRLSASGRPALARLDIALTVPQSGKGA